MYPANADLLVEMGRKKLKNAEDIREADRYISRAIQLDPNHETGLALRKRTRDLSIARDNQRLVEIDAKKDHLRERQLAQVKTNYKPMATLNEQYYQFMLGLIDLTDLVLNYICRFTDS